MMNRFTKFIRNLDVIFIVRALLFTMVAAVVIGIVVLSLQIDRLIKFLRRFDALFVWTLLIIGSWAVVIAFALLIISFI